MRHGVLGDANSTCLCFSVVSMLSICCQIQPSLCHLGQSISAGSDCLHSRLWELFIGPDFGVRQVRRLPIDPANPIDIIMTTFGKMASLRSAQSNNGVHGGRCR